MLRECFVSMFSSGLTGALPETPLSMFTCAAGGDPNAMMAMMMDNISMSQAMGSARELELELCI